MGVTILYALSGWLGLFMAVPPGYATPVWPASGLALAVILIGGHQFGPAIWAGSFLVNYWNSLNLQVSYDIWHGVFPSMIIGFGATTQALFGAWLVRRLFANPVDLIRGKQIIGFLCATGPVSCLISPVIGVTALLINGDIQFNAAFTNGWVWWVGDSIGVIVFAPMVMSFFAEPAGIWRKRIFSLVLPGAVCFIGVIVLFIFMKHMERVRIGDYFENQGQLMTRSLTGNMERHIDILYCIQGFFKGSDFVSRDEFKSYYANLHNHEHVAAVYVWIPLIKESERDKYENAVRKEGRDDFKIVSRSKEGTFVKAVPRDAYLPIEYVEPMDHNNFMIGYDLYSDLSIRPTLERAWLTGEPAMTQMADLPVGSRGNFIFLAIYDRESQSGLTVDERKKSLKGFVGIMIDSPKIARQSFKEFETEYMDICIYDQNDSGPNRTVYRQGNFQGKPGFFTGNIERKMTIGGRTWKIQITPTDSYMLSMYSWMFWCILIGGVLICGFLISFLLAMTGREQMVSMMVDEKTRDLKKLNENLSDEVFRSQRITQSLDSRNKELEQFNLSAVDREMRIIELKRQVNVLSDKLGLPPPYDLSFLEGDERQNP